MKSRTLFLVFAVVGAGALGFVLLTTSVSEKGEVRVGKVPEARAECTDREEGCRPQLDLVTLDGERITEEDLAGKIVMVNFWATWCRPCVKEMPALQAVYDRYEDQGFVIIGLLADRRASEEQARAFLRQHGVTYPVVRSTPELEALFGHPTTLPTSFLYDETGHLRADFRRAIPEDVLENEVGGLFATMSQ